jgi:glycine/D-amino acid oxidase-like deaminating enzyme
VGHRDIPGHINQLLTDEQFRHDANVVVSILRSRVWGVDASVEKMEVLNAFYGMDLKNVLENHKPPEDRREPADSFWAHYYTALRHRANKHAWRLLNRRLIEVQVPDGAGNDDDQPFANVVDGRLVSPEEAAIFNERARLLHDCIRLVLDRIERKIVRAVLIGEDLQEVVAALNIDGADVLLQHARALGKLKQCLERKLAPLAQPPRVVLFAGGPEIGIDVLIVGGGVAGLFTLADLLRQRYSALLLEKDDLGGGQTCHSHLLIHGGHFYKQESLASLLKEAASEWKKWLDVLPPVERAFGPPIHGFRSLAAARSREALWKRVGLDHQELPDPPHPLSSEGVRFAWHSNEIALRGHSLMSALKSVANDRIGRVDALEFDVSAAERVDRVGATLPGGERIVIRPGAVVFAAGSANQSLVNDVRRAAGRSERSDVQQVRQSHMLAIKGTRDNLPPVTGVFQLSHTLFIVARKSGDDVVWLVSDERSTPVRQARHDDYEGMRRWSEGTFFALRELAPDLFVRPERRRLQWLGYSAPKAEGFTPTGKMPDAWRNERCATNVWAMWPSKLTLAPLASRAMVKDLGLVLGARKPVCPPPVEWSHTRCDVPAARERWETMSDMWKPL